ncbi:hypothetical protein CKO15_03470 [Halorhodospira abdelmalekii]|uniref:hypothetical protein n=1 Tax=Halorhodospira abdelmalekii TaxID=421629 RepID=UPI001903A6B0|nr:hypothetical protein [Halorhodospira abdelmalekii]MBK1734358.1 hypothetical protein [Halorhodospira abdelmalekii]
MINQSRAAVAGLILGGVFLCSQAVASDKTFYFNYSHTPVFLTDSANGDIYGNAFEFGVAIDSNLRAGVYHEDVSTENIGNLGVRGISAEYHLGRNQFAAGAGFMIGNEGSNMVADIFGRFILLASDNANMNARLAYRSAPDTDAGAGDMNGVALSVGFGLTF